MTASPTEPPSRYVLVDVVRGFALYGVLLANMVWTTQWFALTNGQRAAIPTAATDPVFGFLVFALVDYKFYTLFAMLFGLGFAMQLSKAAERGPGFLRIYIRRILILLVIGLAHGFFLWFGDILHQYALIGLILILFRNRSDRFILTTAAAIALFTALMPFIRFLGVGGLVFDGSGFEMSAGERFAVMTEGTWRDVVEMNMAFFVAEYSHWTLAFDSALYWWTSILWKFMVGFVVGRRMWLQNAREHVDMYRRIFPRALLIGLYGSAFLAAMVWFVDDAYPEVNSALLSLLWLTAEVGLVALSAAYLSGLVLLFQRPAWRRRLEWLAPVGRMALTNYLMQSVLLVALFYGQGLGLLGRVGTTGCIALSIVLFGGQILFSRWWLTRFRFGLMEWLWRSVTYGKLQPLRGAT